MSKLNCLEKMKKKRNHSSTPFPFVFDFLETLEVHTKPMFGCLAIYVKDKIVLILRDKEDYPSDNGVWLATTHEHHESLQTVFPSMRSLALFDSAKPTAWQNLPADSPDFEASVEKACDLIRKGDPRIGKVPARKKVEKRVKKREKLASTSKKRKK